ncbi:MAG: N-acetylmuramoyl-L-alanine amidase [Enhydrobacter sp.]|nr:MAG: N-acetylmuramoyl-L-alanine amidase [Enhydrobacter sp.]
MRRRDLLALALILGATPAWAAPKVRPKSFGKPAPKPAPKPRPRLIAIDPGHGGRDPGAIGGRGTREKTVALQVARLLQAELQAKGRYRVLLTRSTDIYLPLRARVARAQNARADLFLSLHADAHPNPEVRGASIYTLSNSASDREAEALAAKENRDEGRAMMSDTVTRTLVAMEQRGTVNDSRRMARTIVTTFGRSGVRLLARAPHREAGFAVLTASDVPACLVELGYLSNRHDEKLLTVRQHQLALARALRAAVDAHFAPVDTRRTA